MADVGFVAWIIECVGQVAAQHDILAEVFLLANAERSAEHTHVGMHAHQHDVISSFLFEKVEYLLPIVADAVVADDLDIRMLMPIGRLVRPSDGIVATGNLCFAPPDVIDDRPGAFVPGTACPRSVSRRYSVRG